MGKIKSVISFGGYIALAASLFLNAGALSADPAYNYDVNGDGVVNVLDYLNLRAHLLGTGNTSPASPEKDYNSIYKDIITNLDNVIKADEDEETITGLAGSIGLQEFKGVYALSTETAEDFIGYSIKDINGDGISELLIGEIENYSDGVGYGHRIIALFTCEDDEPVNVFEGTSRSAHYYAGGSDFVYEGAGGASLSVRGTFTLEKNSTEVTWKDFYFTDLDETALRLYHNTTGIWDTREAELVAETEAMEKLNDITKENSKKIVKTELTPFSALSYSSVPAGAQVSTYFTYRFENINEADIPSTEYTENIIFYTKEKVTDFKVLALTVTDTDSEGAPSYSTEVVYSQKALTEDTPLSVSLEFADVYALNGISYVDGNGTERRYYITKSGKDGTVHLTAF